MKAHVFKYYDLWVAIVPHSHCPYCQISHRRRNYFLDWESAFQWVCALMSMPVS
jgi:hypothetical protein